MRSSQRVCALIGFLSLVASIVAAVPAVGAEPLTFTDNFNATAAPGGGNDYNLNAELGVRQGGTLAPASYTRIAGGANLVQVNTATPDGQAAFIGESGLGKMDIFITGTGVTFVAAQLPDIVPAGHSLKLTVDVYPVSNHAALDREDWTCICVGATGGNGSVNAATSGVGMLIRDNGGIQIFNNGLPVGTGNATAAGMYQVEITLDAYKERYSLKVGGQPIVTDLPVAATGNLIQIGGYSSSIPPNQSFTMHLLDNLSLETTPAPVIPCFTTTRPYGDAPLEVSFDAACSIVQGTVQSYAWNFGDGGTGSGKTADHVYGAPGDYTVTLTATDTDAYSASVQRVVRVYEPVTSFSDDFERLDGTVGGWTTAAGTWSLLGGLLATGPTATVQPTLYAGSPVKSLPRNTTFQWQQSFLAPGSNATVGRHAGLLLGANLPFTRTANQFAGYLVDWIDRASDRGVRLSRIDPGPVNVTLAAKPATAPAQPPLNWRVEIEDDHIRVYGDDVLYHDVVDSTYRGGVFGFWAHETAQEVRFDNLVVTSRPVTAYIDISASPTMPVFVTTPVRLSAALSEVIEGSIASYEWNFGDGTTGAGLEVEHTYPVPDPYTVTLTVTTDGGLNDQATKDLTARSLYADCFGRAAGPVDGWTVSSGEWLITEAGKLTKSPSATENFAWAGVPAEMFGGDFAVELDFVFGDTATTSPFQHGGIMFYASEPTHRYATGIDGYTFDWIKRDNAYRLLRVDNAVHVPLVTATEVSGVPATRWRLEVVGDTIRVFGNGVQILEAVDATYRKGHFGLWAFSNNQSLVIDNVSIPPSAPAACKVELTCSVTDEDPPRLNVQAVAGTVGCMPAGCTCAAMDILVDGTVVGTLTPDAAGAAQGAFPLPDPCAPGSTHVVSARCAATGPEATPEATCEFICPTPAGGLQRPGDCNQDAKMDISDGICIFGHLFLGNPSELACGDKTIGAPGNVTMLDHNGDAKIDISDGISLLSFLFQGGPPPVVGTACLRIVGCSDPPVECVDP